MNQRSINKLRRKFIVIATLSYMTAMLIMGGLMYAVNLYVTQGQISSLLDYLIEKEGELEALVDEETVSYEEDEAASVTEQTFVAASDQEDEKKGHRFFPNALSLEDIFDTDAASYDSPDFLYSTRFFAVLFDSQENVTEVKTSHIAAVAQDEAISYARSVLHRMLRFGHDGIYYYKRGRLEDEGTIVVFLDSRSTVATNSRLLFTVLILMGFGLILVVVLVRYFSWRMVQPEIEAVRRQEQFITNASHELKTPLAVIRANTEVEQMLNGENEWNQSTMRQVDRMTGLIQNLVMISRAQEKEDTLTRTPVELSRVVAETAETFLPVATQDGKRMEQDIAPDLKLLADESEIRQLASLLLDNAIKYCDEAGTIRVTLSAARNHAVRMAVSNDYAEGKDVDYSRFFDRFYRQDEARTIDKGGYGIGLSIAESLVNQYHGDLSASWKDGVITFTCLLRGTL